MGKRKKSKKKSKKEIPVNWGDPGKRIGKVTELRQEPDGLYAKMDLSGLSEKQTTVIFGPKEK